VKHSAPSVSKYREVQALLAEFTGLSAERIYATYASKADNISVRSSQSPRAENATLVVFVVKRTDQDAAMERAARSFAERRNKIVLVVQRNAERSEWTPRHGFAPHREHGALDAIDRIQESLGTFPTHRFAAAFEPSPSTAAATPLPPAPFTRLESRSLPPANGKKALFLVPDAWDDFGYKTSFHLHYRDGKGKLHEIGPVKIATTRQEPGDRTPVPAEFTTLQPGFFSLAQDDTYYQRLVEHEIREGVLSALHDIAFDEREFSRAIEHQVTKTSLLRGVPQSTVEVQFRRIAHGGARLTNYSFKYISQPHEEIPGEALDLTFEVTPQSNPPTNIHVVVGSNGAGKTTLLKGMANTLALSNDLQGGAKGAFKDLDLKRDHEIGDPPFSNVVFVSFSAFDPFLPQTSNQTEGDAFEDLFSHLERSVPISYIGLRHRNGSDQEAVAKSASDLAREFINAVHSCNRGAALRERWKRAVSSLEVDPIFRDCEVVDVVSRATAHYAGVGQGVPESEIFQMFHDLSSGHKVVLLTLTRLVESLHERSLVLFDEPESHLHPPLLSAFVGALSNLLVDRNGVAIIATHSPVVLQEVPRSCVWKLRRSGALCAADRPQIETFGENVGVLTHEVFGLEVAESGYHANLRRIVADVDTFDEVMNAFGRQLGGEAQGVARILLAMRNAGGME
jgi:predicted ATPase